MSEYIKNLKVGNSQYKFLPEGNEGEVLTYSEGEPKFKDLGIYESFIETCDVVLVNNKTEEQISVKIYELENFKNTYTPIGIVVIPPSHNVYGTGEAGVMSLLSASLTTPDEGQATNVSMYWGQYGIDTELPNFNVVDHLGPMNGEPQDDIVGIASGGCIPLMIESMNKGKECPTDPGTWYWNFNLSSYYYIPSPYLADGSRNPLYYKVDSPSSLANALSDFNGKSNSELLISLAIAQEDWKTSSSIINNSAAGYSPAACACWRFHTLGTEQGDWYLPARGELGYCASRYDMINTTLSKIARIFGVSVCQLDAYNFWSSSECSSERAQYMNLINGDVVINYTKSNSLYVRPFIRLKLDQPNNTRFYTKSEADSKFPTIKEEGFNVTEMFIEESDESIDVYTKEQVDSKFNTVNTQINNINVQTIITKEELNNILN